MKNQDVIPVKMYGPIYKAIYNYEFLLPTIATAGIGVSNFGAIGITAGALGAFDLIAQYYKIYDKPYLTSATLGWGTLSSFKTPYFISDIIGVSAGLLMPTGLIFQHIDKIVAPISGAISGYSYMGVYGAGMGFALGVIDEGLSIHNITHNYPLTSTLSNIATANLVFLKIGRIVDYMLPESIGSIKHGALELTNFISKPLVKESIAVVISGISLFSEEENEKIKSPALALSEDLYKLYGKIIPKDQLDDLIEKQAIVLIAGNIILAKLGLTFTEYHQNAEEGFINLVQTDESWLEFINNIGEISKFLIPYVGNQIIINYINGYFQTKLDFIVRDKMNDELLTGEVSLLLKKNQPKNLVITAEEVIDSKVLVEKMNGDIVSITYNSLLPGALSSIINGCYAIGHLSTLNALDTIIYSSFYNEVTSEITHAISTKYYNYTTRIDDLNTKLYSKYNHVKVNAGSMVIYDANDFNKAGRAELLDELRSIVAEQSLWEIAIKFWSNANSITNFLFNWLFVADQIYQGDLASNKRSEVISMTQDFSSMVSWDSNNVGSLTQLKQSMDRINELKARINEINNPLEHHPVYHYEISTKTGICLNDFRVGKGDESRLYIKDLCVFDKHVAVTSASGAGKTTFFKAIKQIMHDGVWSEGSITYYGKAGGKPYIAMTSQDIYIPPEDSLLELITFKKGFDAEAYKPRVIELLTRIKIDSVKEGEMSLVESLNDKKDWTAALSGGQKQKIDAVRLMLLENKPDIIIFDEIFAGLDHDSIHDLQGMLSQEFPDTQIFVIDHEAKAHNSENWYANELHLSGGTAELISNSSE